MHISVDNEYKSHVSIDYNACVTLHGCCNRSIKLLLLIDHLYRKVKSKAQKIYIKI